ncbi:MAG: nucleotidyltransferase family protein [Firmicutes bacterium]|nr:nucleotidyltransferase family protein [Bacillota bacterium]
MKLCAVIAEFNPLHNGHKYILQQARSQSGADAVLVVLGGNFSQRGEPSIVNKTVRARMALSCGADIVVELPTYGAVLSAQDFAYESVKIAGSFSSVTHLMFGSESGDIVSISELAEFLTHEPDYFKAEISASLASGNSLPVSKSKALSVIISDRYKSFTNPKIASELLNKPNNILGVEYVKALLKLKSKIVPLTSKRMSNELKPAGNPLLDYTSGSAIRQMIYENRSNTKLRNYMPRESFMMLKQEIEKSCIPDLNIFSNAAMAALRTKSAGELAPVYDMAEGLNNKLVSTALETNSLPALINKITSKRYTSARIQRLALCSLLGIKQESVNALRKQNTPAFVKVLAVKDNPKLLASLNCSCPLLLRQNDYTGLTNPLSRELIRAETAATGIYGLLYNFNDEQLEKYLQANGFRAKTIFV